MELVGRVYGNLRGWGCGLETLASPSIAYQLPGGPMLGQEEGYHSIVDSYEQEAELFTTAGGSPPRS